jgi:Zn-dependent M28 family amino/carboxypeptidase
LGANDNLSGVAVTLGVGEWLTQHHLRHTEVWLVSFACEENMRGSKRFAQRHQKELRDAYLLNFDMVGSGPLMIITAEPMYRTTLTLTLCSKVGEAARTAGLAIPLKRLTFAGTDASNFIKAGLQATSVGAVMPEKGPNYWHTLQDTPDKITPQTLLDAVHLAVTFLQRTDQEQTAT